MMNLSDLIARKTPPDPWTEGEKIPWNNHAFSARMLHEHLSQEHNTASIQAFVENEYLRLLESCGFSEIQTYPSLGGIKGKKDKN